MDTKNTTASEATPPPSAEERNCFYCLGGRVFIGSLDHDGEEVFDAFRCRRCNGTGTLDSE